MFSTTLERLPASGSKLSGRRRTLRKRRRQNRRSLRIEPLEDRCLLASFTGLGDLPGGGFYSNALNVSVVVGYGEDTVGEKAAFRWTQAGGMENLGHLPGGDRSFAWSVSADGSVVVGSDWTTEFEAFRWTQAGGMVSLGAGRAYNVSADGSVVVGWTGYGDDEAFRWTRAERRRRRGYQPRRRCTDPVVLRQFRRGRVEWPVGRGQPERLVPFHPPSIRRRLRGRSGRSGNRRDADPG